MTVTPNAVAIPMRLRVNPTPESSGPQGSMNFEHEETTCANLSKAARAYLASLTSVDPDSDKELSRAIWLHALAIIYAPAYLKEHGPGIREGWPRVPLPTSLDLLHRSAQLGSEIAGLLNPAVPVLGVTTGKLRREISPLGRITGPKSGFDLGVTVGWGHIQKKKGVVMPGKGCSKEREFSAEEEASIAEGSKDLGLALESIKAHWSDKTLDIYLNTDVYWSDVPKATWEYTIGGYQVLKKWLSYRDRSVLGREITKDEAREFTHMVRRLAALILMEQRLDANYASMIDHIYAWP